MRALSRGIYVDRHYVRFDESEEVVTRARVSDVLEARITLIAPNSLYFVVLEAFGGTLGKRILGMRIVKQDGSKPGFGAALVRNLLRVVDALPFAYLLGILMVAKSATKQRLGDRAAKTYVVGKSR